MGTSVLQPHETDLTNNLNQLGSRFIPELPQKSKALPTARFWPWGLQIKSSWAPSCLDFWPTETEIINLYYVLVLKWSESHSVVSAVCDPMDYTVHGILQAGILKWVAFPFSRGSSQPRDQTQVFRIAVGFFTSWATSKALSSAMLW